MPQVSNLIGLGMPPEHAVQICDGVQPAVVNATAAGVRTKQAINNVNDTTPTLAELTTSFGAPATVGSGFVGVVKDNDADTNCFVVVSNGTSFFYLKFTKALQLIGGSNPPHFLGDLCQILPQPTQAHYFQLQD